MKRKEYANFNELVFEERNRFYGAYVLRKQYEDNLLIGLGFGIFVVGAIVAIPYIQHLFTNEMVNNRIIDTMPPTMITIDNPAPDILPPPKQLDVPESQPEAATKTFMELQLSTENKAKPMEELEGFMPGTMDNDGEFSFNAPPTNTNDAIIGNGGGDKNKIYEFVRIEVKPQYPGGDEAMYEYLGRTIQYPEQARRAGIEGRVTVSFVIDEIGTVRDVKVERGIGGGCDEEALRVIRSMKRWKPGRQGGYPVRVRYSIPIQFNFN